MNVRSAFAALSLFALSMGTSQATLIDRGGGLIYDDALNVTWMQDALYARTTGAAKDGRQDYADALEFAESVVYYDAARDVLWDDWRLPTTVNDKTLRGYDVEGQSSELAYMYYVNLGLAADPTLDKAKPPPTSKNYNPFINLVHRTYWSQTSGYRPADAWGTDFHSGFTNVTGKKDSGYAWLLRDGDVAAVSVPEPGTLALLGAGLLGGLFVRRRKT
jgi:hypothetical protein